MRGARLGGQVGWNRSALGELPLQLERFLRSMVVAAREQQAGKRGVAERVGMGDLPRLVVLHALPDTGFGLVQQVPLAQHVTQHDAWIAGYKEAPLAALLHRCEAAAAQIGGIVQAPRGGPHACQARG